VVEKYKIMDDNLLLSPSEELLIKCVRDIGEMPINFLLWYRAGIEESLKKTKKIYEGKGFNPSQIEQRRIDIANKYYALLHEELHK
jgi:hypothetical protein